MLSTLLHFCGSTLCVWGAKAALTVCSMEPALQ